MGMYIRVFITSDAQAIALHLLTNAQMGLQTLKESEMNSTPFNTPSM